MRVALVSRFPMVDTLAWKRTLAGRLLERGVEVGLLYSQSTLIDQAVAGLREFGFGIVGRYLDRSGEQPPSGPSDAQTLDGWAAERGLARHHGRHLREPDTLGWLRGFAPDLLILVGADIVPPPVLEIPSLGTINPHYGLLPRYRGMNVTEWSIYYDDPVGVTVHVVDPGIDTGDILLREALTVRSGATLASIREEQQQASARLLERAAMAVLHGDAHPTPQRLEDGKQFYRLHPLLRQHVERRLADGRYRWLGLEPSVEVNTGERGLGYAGPASTSAAVDKPSATCASHQRG